MLSTITLTLLFIILSPGFLLTLPPVNGKLFMSYKTSLFSIVIHAFIFAGLVNYLYRIEAFRSMCQH
jgi:hypothetical protein